MEGGVVMNDSTHELQLCPILSSQLNLRFQRGGLNRLMGFQCSSSDNRSNTDINTQLSNLCRFVSTQKDHILTHKK